MALFRATDWQLEKGMMVGVVVEQPVNLVGIRVRLGLDLIHFLLSEFGGVFFGGGICFITRFLGMRSECPRPVHSLGEVLSSKVEYNLPRPISLLNTPLQGTMLVSLVLAVLDSRTS